MLVVNFCLMSVIGASEDGVSMLQAKKTSKLEEQQPRSALDGFCRHPNAEVTDHDDLKLGYSESFNPGSPTYRTDSSIYSDDVQLCANICRRNRECMAFVEYDGDNDSADDQNEKGKYCVFKVTGNTYRKEGKTAWTSWEHGEHCEQDEQDQPVPTATTVPATTVPATTVPPLPCIDQMEDSVCRMQAEYCQHDGVMVTIRNKDITLDFATEACRKTCNKC